MGFFSGQPKIEVKPEPQVVAQDEQFDDLPSLPKPRSSTIITQGITFSGVMHGEGVVQVEGVMEGEIELKGSVSVTTSGLVRGPITADVIRVAGRIEGNVTAREHFRLEKTGEINGDISTPSLVVEDGGRLNGRSTMLTPERGQPAAAVAASDALEFGPGYRVGEDEIL